MLTTNEGEKYLSVNEVTVNEQQIALTNDNKYSFVMPDEDVLVQISVLDTRVQQKTPNEVKNILKNLKYE